MGGRVGGFVVEGLRDKGGLVGGVVGCFRYGWLIMGVFADGVSSDDKDLLYNKFGVMFYNK